MFTWFVRTLVLRLALTAICTFCRGDGAYASSSRDEVHTPVVPTIPVRANALPGGVSRCGVASLCVDDAPWALRGMNYFPAYYNCCLDPMWLSPAQFNRDAVVSELTVAAKAGVTAVTVMLKHPDPMLLNHTTDLLAIARSLGLRVVLSVPFCAPGQFASVHGDPTACLDIIRSFGFDNDTTIVGYDIWWEPHVSGMNLTGPYTDWAVDRYGGLDAAQQCLGEDVISVPTSDELCAKGPNKRAVVAARVGLMRTSADGHHLIGLRNGYGGDGGTFPCPHLPLDLRTGRRVLDYVGPEGYAFDRLPSYDDVWAWSAFTNAFAGARRPVVWMEFGVSTRDLDGQGLAFQVQQYEYLGRAFAETGTVGMCPWWLVGVRPKDPKTDKEHSDYGLLWDPVFNGTAMDARGTATRDAWLTLCGPSAQPPVILVVSRDLHRNESWQCPNRMVPLGTFRVADGHQNGTTGIGFERRQVSSGWMTLCGPSRGPVGLYVVFDAATNVTFSCPSGTHEEGRFVPYSEEGAVSAVDTVGRSLRRGWLGLCTNEGEGAGTGLFVTQNELGSHSSLCPAGRSASLGSFKPTMLPLVKPALAAYTDGARRLTGLGSRNYTSYVEVDTEAHASTWELYADGVDKVKALGKGLVGVRSPCDGASFSDRTCVAGFNCKPCPLRCINGEFDGVWVFWEGLQAWRTCQWPEMAIAPACDISDVPHGASVMFAAQVGNVGEIIWPADQVILACGAPCGGAFGRISSELGPDETGAVQAFMAVEKLLSPMTFTLRLQAVSDGAAFGPTVSVRLSPGAVAHANI